MKKMFWGIVFISIASIVSFKGYLWYQVYKQLTDIKEQVAPFATVKYGWIYSTFDGEVGVRDIVITPFLLKGSITIDELSLKVKDAAALFKLGDNLAQRIPPEELLIKTINMSFPLDGQFDELLGSIDGGSEYAGAGNAFNPFGVYSCGDTVAVESAELRSMGYDRFTVSNEVGYRFDSLAQRLIVDAIVDSESMGRNEFKVDISVPGSDIYDAMNSSDMPEINRATWNFNDGGYFRRLSFFCGQKIETKREQYVDQATQEWEADLKDHGIALNASLVDAYRRYILDGGLLKVEVSPDRDIDYSSLSLFSANDIVSMLNLRVTLNGELLSDLSLTVDDQQFANATQTNEQTTQGSDQAQVENIPPVEVEKRYQDTDVEEAETYLRRNALVELDTGKSVEGVIILVDEHIIEIEQIVAGGKVSYPLRKRQIASFKVWR